MARSSTSLYLAVPIILVLAVGECSNSTKKDGLSTSTTEFLSTVPTTTEPPETFELMEKRLKDSVKNLIKSALPHIMSQSSDVNLSTKCLGSLMTFVMAVRNLKDWAFLMLDAFAKPPSGVLEGTFLALGNYDECLDIVVTKNDKPAVKPQDNLFRGQYCMLELRGSSALSEAIDQNSAGNFTNSPFRKSKTFFKLFKRFRTGTKRYSLRMGLCLPSACNHDDVQQLSTAVAKRIHFKANVIHCDVKRDTTYIDKNQLSILCLLAVIFGLVAIGTIVDAVFRIRSGEQEKQHRKEHGRPIQILLSFSIYSNTLRMLRLDVSENSLEVLRGLRVYTLILIIYGSAFGNVHKLHFLKYGSAMNIYQFFDSFTFAAVANGTVLMDTLFFVSGVAVTYSRWRNPDKQPTIKVSRLVLRPFIRMTALQFLVISLFLLFPLLGSGPMWATFTEPMIQNCRERWWMNLLFITNYFSSYDTCLYNTWFLSVLMQLYVITSFLLWLLIRWSSVGMVFIVLLMIGSAVGVGIVTATYHLPGAMAFFMLNTRTAPIIWRFVFLQIYDHLGPYCIGLIAGYLLAKHKDTLKLRPMFVTLGWCLSISCNLAVMTGLYGYRKGDQIEATAAVVYSTVHRNAWALGLSWLVFATSTGHGGPVKQILSWRALIPLDRMCYLAYLFSLPVIYLHTGMIRERLNMAQMDNTFLAVSYLFISFFLAGVCYVLFQAPYHYFESWISSWFAKKDTLPVYEHSKDKPTTSGLPSLTNAKAVRGSFSNLSEKQC